MIVVAVLVLGSLSPVSAFARAAVMFVLDATKPFSSPAKLP
jgi:hypothetical protein